ncbi:MAG: CU044_2847 family protein [Ktedonobacteraceae bacterium]
MSDYVQYDSGDGTTHILVEVEEGQVSQHGGVQKAANVFKKAGDTIASVGATLEGTLEHMLLYNSNAFIHTVSQMPVLPSEAECTFGLKATVEGNFAVAKVTSEANYNIRLTWKREPRNTQQDGTSTKGS